MHTNLERTFQFRYEDPQRFFTNSPHDALRVLPRHEPRDEPEKRTCAHAPVTGRHVTMKAWLRHPEDRKDLFLFEVHDSSLVRVSSFPAQGRGPTSMRPFSIHSSRDRRSTRRLPRPALGLLRSDERMWPSLMRDWRYRSESPLYSAARLRGAHLWGLVLVNCQLIVKAFIRH